MRRGQIIKIEGNVTYVCFKSEVVNTPINGETESLEYELEIQE